MRFHIPLTALPRLAAVAAAGVLVAGCGGGTQQAAPAENETPADGQSSGSPDGREPPETELTIELSLAEAGDRELASEDFEAGTWTLTCAPAGGDHPAPEAACADLEDVGVEAFDEAPGDQMCTHIYGGPETAEVSGHVAGTEVDTEFTRENGCEIDRYDTMGAVLNP
ncbi:hypothetical protein F4561_006455 [Lipingzhangella halophila]|uniref:Subtilisin inhibitor domain-containing protein n=1 Tax=Lipingzhangella halophila TaxID=1783352 RepID=A0A7W7RQ79_9ACTN|nr:SSI family serine proteinase inhibitor [Lipingzhangella halophila]MBB4935561.1 hypothetical protein [Lipingzhangella halophila]